MALITDSDDRALVEQHRAGDDGAFREIVLRHHSSLYGNALRRLGGDNALAEDAVQEAFLRAFRALPRFNGDYHLDAWLHRILTNVCHDLGRRRGRDTRLFDKVSGEHLVTVPPVDETFESMPREQLESALQSLPATYREVLLLRFVDELTYAEVALKADITEENARARVSRGRAMLRRMLDGAAAAVIWLIPPLRRSQLTGGDPEVADQVEQLSTASSLATSASQAAPLANQAAPLANQAAHSAPALSQASAFMAQAAPSLVQAAPAVTSSGPAMGKAAMAVGIAASVAIPAGVAVDKQLDQPRPEPATAAPAPDTEADPAPDPGDPVVVPTTEGPDFSQAPAGSVNLDEDESTTTTTDDVEALESGNGAVAADLDGDDSGGTDESDGDVTAGDTTTTAPGDDTTDDTSTTDTTTDDGSTDGDTAEEPPPPPPPGDVVADALEVIEAGPRLDLGGDFVLTVDGQQLVGTLTGKVLVGEADAKDPEAPRQVEGDLVFEFADGTTADLRIRGEATVTEQGKRTVYDLSAAFRLDGGAAHDLAESGDLTGTLETADGEGGLWLTLPGAPADDSGSTDDTDATGQSTDESTDSSDDGSTGS